MSELRNRKGKVTPENEEEARKLRQIWDAAKAFGRVGSQESFGALYGIGNQAAVGFFLNGKTALSMKAAIGFAKGLDCQVAEFSPRLAKEIEDIRTATEMQASIEHNTRNQSVEGAANPHESLRSQAHSMSHQPFQNVPTKTEWGALRVGELPAEFGVHLPDDSMAPEAKAGALVWFERGLEPRPGDWVLVIDQANNWFMREYRQRRPGDWYAFAVNSAFDTLEPARDGIEVAAVFVGMKARRS